MKRHLFVIIALCVIPLLPANASAIPLPNLTQFNLVRRHCKNRSCLVAKRNAANRSHANAILKEMLDDHARKCGARGVEAWGAKIKRRKIGSHKRRVYLVTRCRR